MICKNCGHKIERNPFWSKEWIHSPPDYDRFKECPKCGCRRPEPKEEKLK